MQSHLVWALLCAFTPALAQDTPTAVWPLWNPTPATSDVFNMLAIATPTNEVIAPYIQASVVAYTTGQDRVTYSIECNGPNPTQQPGCDLLHKAAVTVGPNTMMILIGRVDYVTDVNSGSTTESAQTIIGTADCELLPAQTSANCRWTTTDIRTALLMRTSVTITVTVSSSVMTVSRSSATSFASAAQHTVPVKVIGGLEKVPPHLRPGATVTSTSSSTGAAPRPTQQAVLAGVAAVVGGMALV